jgi:sarcosine reductase
MDRMNLTLEYIKVQDIQWGDRTTVKKQVLYVNAAEAIEVLQDSMFSGISLDIARPGENIRIIPVKDVIEPRVKVKTGEFFPGFLGGFDGIGDGVTKVLKGCDVVTTGRIVGFQEGIIDMAGPGAEYCPYGKKNHVVLIAEPIEGIDPVEHETAVRIAGIKLAHYLAKACMDIEGDEKEEFSLPPVDPDKKLPRVMYVNLLLAQGLLHDNYVYGMDEKKLQTTLMHPNELLDGAVVSGNCVTASTKNTTYDYENNPVIMELYKRHGKEVDFCGVISTPSNGYLAGKERGALCTASIASLCHADALIIAEEGGGNPEADIMMIAEAAEDRGIKCVILLHEVSGDYGESEPLANTSPKADAVVTLGNVNEYVYLPKMERIIGHADALVNLAGCGVEPLKPDGSLRVRLASIMDSVSNIGITTRTGRTY